MTCPSSSAMAVDLRILVFAEERVHEYARPEFLVYGADERDQVPEEEQHDNQRLNAGILECVGEPQEIFLGDEFAGVRAVPQQDAQHQA